MANRYDHPSVDGKAAKGSLATIDLYAVAPILCLCAGKNDVVLPMRLVVVDMIWAKST